MGRRVKVGVVLVGAYGRGAAAGAERNAASATAKIIAQRRTETALVKTLIFRRAKKEKPGTSKRWPGQVVVKRQSFARGICLSDTPLAYTRETASTKKSAISSAWSMQ